MDPASSWLPTVAQMRRLAYRSIPFRQAGGASDYLAAPFTPQCLISRQCSATNAAPASRPRPIPACRPVASPLPLRYLSVVPLIAYQRYDGEVTEGQRSY